MKNKINRLLWAAAGAVLLAVIAVSVLPKPKITRPERARIHADIEEYNSKLPRKIGTIGWLCSAAFEGDTLIYRMSVNGSAAVDTLYENNYNVFRKIMLYSFIINNGNGKILSDYCESKGIYLKWSVTTPSGRAFEWKIPPSEMSAFVDSCRKTPTEALHDVIDIHVKLANMELPLAVDSFGDIHSVAVNALSSAATSDGDILVGIRHAGDDVEFDYSVSEREFSMYYVAPSDISEDEARLIADEMAEDDDMRELMCMLAISRSNLVLNYTARKSGRKTSIRLPYDVIMSCRGLETLRAFFHNK